MGLGKIFLIWMMFSELRRLQYSTVHPNSYAIPIAILTLIGRKPDIFKTTTIAPSSIVPSPSSTDVVGSTTQPPNCLRCSSLLRNNCPVFGCVQAPDMQCVMPEGEVSSPLICGQIIDEEYCGDLGCDDFVGTSCTPADREIVCSGISENFCLRSLSGCCEFQNGMCIQV